MTQEQTDWAAIANSPKFIELHRRKTTFLFSWWVVGSLSYFILLLAAACTPEIFRVKLVGNINCGYFFCLFQFLLGWGIAMFYAYKANKDFDRLTEEVIGEIEGGISL